MGVILSFEARCGAYCLKNAIKSAVPLMRLLPNKLLILTSALLKLYHLSSAENELLRKIPLSPQKRSFTNYSICQAPKTKCYEKFHFLLENIFCADKCLYRAKDPPMSESFLAAYWPIAINSNALSQTLPLPSPTFSLHLLLLTCSGWSFADKQQNTLLLELSRSRVLFFRSNYVCRCTNSAISLFCSLICFLNSGSL